jgi:hypothetical protein
MNRQQKRERERRSKKYEGRNTFSKKEVEEMNALSYNYGVRFVFQAIKGVYGWGDVRLDRLRDKLADLEQKHFTDFEPIDYMPPYAKKGGGTNGKG